MTKVFISFSYRDKKFVEKLSHQLQSDKIKVWTNEKEFVAGDNIAEKITDAISKTDYFIVVLSKNSVNSSWVNFELSATRLNEISKQQNIILPVLIDDCEIPFSLRDRFYSDFRFSFDDGYAKLIAALKAKKTKEYNEPERQSDKSQSDSYEYQIKNLQSIYNSGNLTLFCGAGISYEAGIPLGIHC